MQKLLGLIDKAKAGDEASKNELFLALGADGRAKGAMRNLYRGAACLEFGDIEAEFWRGVLLGLALVKRDIGDPIAHLIQRGVWQVKTAMREELSKKVLQRCLDCGRTNGKYSKGRKCSKCGNDTENVYRLEPYDHAQDGRSYLDSVAWVQTLDIRNRLQARQQAVFDALLRAFKEDPESPVSAAAKALGISRQRLHQHLNKIRLSVQS